MSPALTRRSLVQVGATVLGAVVAGIPASARAGAAVGPATFDPTAFLADLTTAGYRVSAYYDVPCCGSPVSPPSYIILPPKGRGFGAACTAVMERWHDAMETCPDHVEEVVAYLSGLDRASS